MSRLASHLRRLHRDRRGAATIEFAMWSAFFFMGMMVALDFALWRTQELRVNSAVEQGALIAFSQRAAMDATVAGQIRTYVGAAATAGGVVPAVTAKCNGSTTSTTLNATCVSTSRPCVCANRVGTTTTYAPAACNTACTSTPNTRAGYYMQIGAQLTYHSAILPSDLLSGKTMADSVVVRLE